MVSRQTLKGFFPRGATNELNGEVIKLNTASTIKLIYFPEQDP